MIRKPLQLVDSNAQKNAFPIFDDFKAAPIKPNTVHSAKKIRTTKRNSLANRLLVVVVIVQQKELRVAQLRSAFLKLANNSLAQKPTLNEVHTKPAPRVTTNTPKKRRFEDSTGRENDDLETEESLVSSTPPRSRSNTLHSTPHSSKRESATPNAHHSRPILATPARPPLVDATNRVNNRSVLSDQAAESPKGKQQPAAGSLSDRLKQVEESLQKLQVLGDLENVRAAAATLKSPQRTRIYNALRSDSAELAQNTFNNSVKENNNRREQPKQQQHTAATEAAPAPTTSSKPQPVPTESTFETIHMPLPGHSTVPAATVLGTGRNLQAPQLVEHLVLQATIQRATKASIKTLLKGRDILPHASETRDQLAAYQQDSAKIATSLSPVHPNPTTEASTQAKLLEASIVHYHHTTSGLYPLSPLGDQSIRGHATAPVPLSELSLLQEKMTSWRTKYATTPTAPPS